MQCMQVERKTKWVENSLLRVDEKAEKCFDVAKEASDNKLFAGYAPLSEGWYKGMKGDEVLGYFGCPRFLDDCLIGDGEEPNCGSSFGKWKAVDGPQAFYMGGSYILSSKNALYPEIAADIIKTICLDTDTMKKIALEEKTFVNSTAAVEAIIADGDVQNELLGGQDYFAAFAKAAKAVDISCRSEYDAKINAELSKAAAGYASGKTDKEAALKSFSAAVHSLYPELSAEE